MGQNRISDEIMRNWFDQLLKSQDRQEKKLDDTFSKIGSIDDRVQTLESSSKYYQDTVGLLSQQVWHGEGDNKGSLKERVTRTEERISELTEEINTLKSNIFNRRTVLISGSISGIVGLITFVLGLAFTANEVVTKGSETTSTTTKKTESSTIIKKEESEGEGEGEGEGESGSEEQNNQAIP